MNGSDFIIIGVLVLSVGIIYKTSLIFVDISQNDGGGDTGYNWVLHLFANVITYSTIILPGFIVYKFVERTKYLENRTSFELNWFFNVVRACYGNPDEFEKSCDENFNDLTEKKCDSISYSQNYGLLVSCGLGLQIFYLTWGVLQEKVMTKSYSCDGGKHYQFGNSQFLVFINRVLAFVLAGVYLTVDRQPSDHMPYYKYIYCSFSNVMSSWCQYEALKFISFPTQVLAKASKVIPVMLMSRLISKKHFPSYEYYTSFVMSFGLVIFMLESPETTNANKTTNISGAILLILYLILDSFTSNWQDSLFQNYHVSSVQMMFGVNLFSCLFTLTSLLQQHEFFSSVAFMFQFPIFMMDCITLSVCSAVGQLLIFFTISKFGPVVFALIMTVRQFLAVLLSYLIYDHSISAMAVLGVVIFFGSIFLRQYLKQIEKPVQKPENI